MHARVLFVECNDRRCYMHGMQISAVDLNLAVVLRALLDERSVSRAARRLGLSQSATSHALGRLRTLVQDPLFVRTRTGIVPTARAEAMADIVRSSVGALEATFLTPRQFDPRTVERTFRIRPSDYVEYLIIPRLLERLAKVAPRVSIFARPMATEPTLALEEGQLDLLIQPTRSGEQTDGFHMEELWDERLVGIARRGHPLTKGRVTLERFASASHALVSPRGEPGGMVDDVLKQHGMRRRIAFTTPSFLVAPHVVAMTDLVMVLPERIATALQEQLRLATFEPPLEVPGFRMAMFWHDRHDSDPAHAFIRREIAQVAALPSPASLTRRRKRRTARGLTTRSR
jgi:DNA-binding transcriptional LysR family regulator